MLKHSDLILFMTSLGYKGNARGVCFGVAATSIGGALLRETDETDRRLEAIEKIIQDARTIVGANASTEVLKEKIAELVNRHPQKWDLYAYCEAIDIHFAPKNYGFLFDTSNQTDTHHQNTSLTIPLLTPTKLENEQDGITQLRKIGSIYRETELTQYFTELRESIEKANIQFPITFMFSTLGHAITVSYDPQIRRWSMVDANQLPTQHFTETPEQKNILDQDKKIADSVSKAFYHQKVIGFTCTAYVAGKNKVQAEKWDDERHKANISRAMTSPLKEKTEKNNTWLHFAAVSGDTDLVKKLLQKGMNPNAKNKPDQLTPLFVATQCNQVEVIKVLIESGANLNAQTSLKNTALNEAISDGNNEIAQLFIEKNAQLNIKNLNDRTPLHLAAISNNTEIVKLLLSKNVSVNEKDKYGMTPLHHAAISNNTEIIKLLLSKNVSVNEKDKYGMTPLHYAIKKGNKEIVELLLAHGAKPEIKNKVGHNSFDIAKQKQQKEILALLVQEGKTDAPKSTPLQASISALSTQALPDNEYQNLQQNITQQIKTTTNINEKNEKGYTALHYAASYDDTDTIEQLIQRHANIEAISNGGASPLHLAVYKGQADSVHLLLKKGADPNQRHLNGNTILHTAIQQGHIEFIPLLLAHGANPNLKNAAGQTAFEFAKQRNKPEALVELNKAPKQIDSKPNSVQRRAIQLKEKTLSKISDVTTSVKNFREAKLKFLSKQAPTASHSGEETPSPKK